MTFGTAIRTSLRKFATFSGRASRSEFWYFVLFVALGAIAMTILSGLIFGPTLTQELTIKTYSDGRQTSELVDSQNYDGGWMGQVFNLLIALPLVAAAWRRLHDTGRKGWLAIIPVLLMAVAFIYGMAAIVEVPIDPSLIPEGRGFPSTIPTIQNPLVLWALGLIQLAYLIILIWWLSRPSQPGTNAYGPNPLEVTQ